MVKVGVLKRVDVAKMSKGGKGGEVLEGGGCNCTIVLFWKGVWNVCIRKGFNYGTE